jgi:hypothetical protein
MKIKELKNFNKKIPNWWRDDVGAQGAQKLH